MAGAAGAEEERPACVYLRPELARLMDAVTFHVSFDRDSMVPDMAEGPAWTPKLSGSYDKSSPGPQFAAGLIGRALVLGSGRAAYPRPGNVPLEQRGAVAFWIKPQGWTRPSDRNVTFVMTSNATFYLQRQGPMLGPDNKVLRHEGIQYLARDGDRLANVTGDHEWANDRWYLVVANWSWPAFELSINARPFAGKALTGVPKESLFADLAVGDAGASPRGLLDELFVFRRPLTIEEVQLLWKLGR